MLISLKLRNLLFFILLTFSLSASEKTTVFMLHSYSEEYPWTKGQHSSFISNLNKINVHFEFYTEYLDSKRLELTTEYKNNFIQYLKLKYANINPDLIYVTDDNALKLIAENHNKIFLKERERPVFFSGINDLSMHNILPRKTFSGVYEVKEIKPNIELIKQFSPQTRDIYFIGDDSETYQSIKKELILQEKDFTTMNFKYISSQYISIILQKLPNKPRSFVLLTTIGNLKDDNNNTLQPKESISIINQNQNLNILSMEDAYMYEGVIGGYMTSANKQGEEAADLVIQYLKRNSLENIHSILKSPNIYMFNWKSLTNSRVILSEYIARNALITGKNATFIETNTSMLLNILVIIMIILILGILIMYVVKRKKYEDQDEKLKKLASLRTKLYIKNQLIHNTFVLGKIGYWRLDTNKDKLFISEELLEILEIDYKIYKDDSEILYYFLNSNDKKLFSEKLSEVQSSHKAVSFNHKMTTLNKTVFNVSHLLYTENIEQNISVLVGIIKFEK